MKIYCIQHVPFEGLGCIHDWILKNNHALNIIKMYENVTFPQIKDVDFLIIMGGPMGVYDEDKYKWLGLEKQFIKELIENNKKVLGVCLGAQLIANVLGAEVYANPEKEIGWFPVSFDSSFSKYCSFEINSKFKAFHWHGDTFNLPEKANLLSSSIACKNQIFEFSDNVVGIQYHLEVTPHALKAFVDNCGDELDDGQKFVQTATQILSSNETCNDSNKIMYAILDALTML